MLVSIQVSIQVSLLSLHLRHSRDVNSVDICCLTSLGWCSSRLPSLIRLWRAKYIFIVEPVSVFLCRLLCLSRFRSVDDVLDVTSPRRWSLCWLIFTALSILWHYIDAIVSKICPWLSANFLFILFSILLWLFALMLWHPRLLESWRQIIGIRVKFSLISSSHSYIIHCWLLTITSTSVNVCVTKQVVWFGTFVSNIEFVMTNPFRLFIIAENHSVSSI